MKTWIALLFAALLSTSPFALAQAAREGRELSSRVLGKTIGKDHVAFDRQGKAYVRSKTLHAGDWTWQTGVVAPGGIETLGPYSTCGFLVAGRSSTGAGIAEHWAFNSGSGIWELASSLNIPASDFSGVAFDGTNLYLLDCVTNTILRGVWTVSQSLSATPFTVWVGVSEVPLLLRARSVSAWAVDLTNLPGVAAPGIFLVGDDQVDFPFNGVFVYQSTSGPSSLSYMLGTSSVLTYPVILDTGLVDGDSIVTVAATPLTSVEVLNAQGVVVGSGTSPSVGGEFGVPISQVIHVGELFSVRSAGSARLCAARAIRRHGFPEQFMTGESLTRMTMSPATYNLGNTAFRLYCDVERPLGGPEICYSGLVIVGFGSDPVVPFDNGQGVNQALVSQYWFGVSGYIGENLRRGFVEIGMPIPSDPGLEGLVLLTQFVVGDSLSGGFRLSEVIGFKLLGSP